MTDRNELVDIDGEVLFETEKAIRFNDGSTTVWLPKSLTEINDDGTITIPMWLAEEKELV